LVYPDPSNPEIAENYRNGKGQVFEKIGRLPMWNEENLKNIVEGLRHKGAEHICFKTGPFDTENLIRILKIASSSGVDLVTFDGAGGGSGNSPVKMMNEWGMPTVYLESILYNILKKMKEKKYPLPQVAIAGGFAMEDQVFKGLALGAPFINIVGIGRAAMSAAMVGNKVGELLDEGIIPKEFQRFGSSKEEIFGDIRELKLIYGEEATDISTGAIGVYSYINRICTGLRQLMALNRKFSLEYINRNDIYPLTRLSSDVSGIPSLIESALEEIEKI